MPITKKDLKYFESLVPHYFMKPGEALVRTGPCQGTLWKGDKIPLDGRHYMCAGRIILKTGMELPANLNIRTHTFDFLEREAVHCRVGDTWYEMNEPELYAALGISREQALPYTWLPDRPFDSHDPGPYPMDWYASVKKTGQQP